MNRLDNMTRSAQGWEQDSQALGMGEPPLWLVTASTAHLPINSHGF